MKMEDFEYTTCSSPNDPTVGAHIGVQITHTRSGVVVSSIAEKTQYSNKKVALKKLEAELNRYDVILPLSRFKREINKVLHKFEKNTWKLILITHSKKPLLVITEYCKRSGKTK